MRWKTVRRSTSGAIAGITWIADAPVPIDADALAAQVDRVVPARRVHRRTGERLDARDVGQLGLAEDAGRADHVAGADLLAVGGVDAPDVRLLVERRADDLRVQADAVAHAVLVHAVLRVCLELAPGAYTRDQSLRFSNENW